MGDAFGDGGEWDWDDEDNPNYELPVHSKRSANSGRSLVARSGAVVDRRAQLARRRGRWPSRRTLTSEQKSDWHLTDRPVVKRRPKNRQVMTKPRHERMGIPHRRKDLRTADEMGGLKIGWNLARIPERVSRKR